MSKRRKKTKPERDKGESILDSTSESSEYSDSRTVLEDHDIFKTMAEEELAYMLDLLDNITDDIYDEFTRLFNETDERKTITLTNQIVQFLKNNLRTNPVTTCEIIKYMQQLISDTELLKINSIINEFIRDGITENDADKLITTLAITKWNEEATYSNDLLKQIGGDSFKQHRKQVLISLIPQNKPELIHLFTDMIYRDDLQREFKLTADYMLELCYEEKIHWLLKAAAVYKQELHDMKTVTFEINNFTKQLLFLVLIDLTNCPESYDLPSLINQLTNIYSILDNYTTSDKQLQFYLIEIKRELTLIKFCMENNCKILSTSIFNQVLVQSALTVISQVCRLSRVDRYKVSKLLTMNNDYIYELQCLSNKEVDTKSHRDAVWDISTYNSYCIITKVIDTILNSSEGSENMQEINSAMEEIKRLVLALQPLHCCIEVIENIFSCLFLRYEYFSCYEHNQDIPCGTHSECSYFYSKKQNKSKEIVKNSNTGFICSSFTTQEILNMLKMCIETLSKKIGTQEINISTRFKRLADVVNHSIWKMQLVSTLPPDTSPAQLKLCMDYVKVDNSSEDDDSEFDMRMKKKPKVRRRFTNPKPEPGKTMLTSTISADEACSVKRNTIDFISIMLAKPICLVALALHHNDFPKANQILEMFDLFDSEIATEVAFTEQLRNLIAKLKNIICYRDCSRYPSKELSALSVVSTEVMGLVEGFLAANRAPNSFDVIELGSRHPHLQLYTHKNSPFINAVDILISSGLNREITYGLINVVERKLAEVRSGTDTTSSKNTKNYIKFVEDIASVTFEIFGNTDSTFTYGDNICELITDCRIPIKHKDFCKLNQLSRELKQCCRDLEVIVNSSRSKELDSSVLQKYHQIYMNVVAASDKDLCNIAEVTQYNNKKTRVHYLRKCYMYAKSVSQLKDENVLDEALLTTAAPYFAILERHLHDIFGNMINNQDLPITHLEAICKKLNVNLIPKLILNFCPSITLVELSNEASEESFNNLLHFVFDFKNPEEKLFIEPIADFAPLPRTPDPQCLTYVILHNWVLAHIIKKIHTALNDTDMQQSIDARTKCLNKFMDLERFDQTKVLFNNNKYLASLHTTIDLDQLFLYLPKLLECGKILQCLRIIDSLSERQVAQSANLNNLKDLILYKLSTNSMINQNWKFCQHVKCPDLKVDLIFNNLNCWTPEGALELISSILGTNNWYNTYEKSIESPEHIVEVLMDNQQFKLCLDWADLHNVSDHMKNLIIINLLRQLFEFSNLATPSVVRGLLHRLSPSEALNLILAEIQKVRNIEIIKVCLEFINDHSISSKAFENIKIGLHIVLEMEPNLRHLFWDLTEKPILMIEQLLMNGKLDILNEILNKISPHLKNDSSGDYLYYNMKTIESVTISRNAVDSLLRFYAEKALDMISMANAVTRPSPPKPWDDALLLSIDSINLEGVSKPFVMPEQVPTKEQWVKDYTVDRCMLCRISIFSLIIRRHHCRRCGRVVCHACSTSRMQVPTYPSGVKFRVCDDCYTQTTNTIRSSDNDNMIMSSDSSAGSTANCLDWCLSTADKKNAAVRAEFSYEFTPNVTLCFDELARELCEGSCGDSRWLVRARRSLLLAAAELYSRTAVKKSGCQTAETGAAHVARCLSHVEAMATLVQHQAQHLVPQHGAHPSQMVRSLLEAEKWELALEIATKSGIPRTSVLAAWGKTCLKAGCYREARRKFALCFKTSPNVFVDGSDELEYGKEASEAHFVRRQNSRSSGSVSTTGPAEVRVRNDPPLLNEIIKMLENINYPVNQHLLDKAETIKTTNETLSSMNTGKKKLPFIEPALNIMHMLASVKRIKQGDYSDLHTAPVHPKKSLAHGLLRRNTNVEAKPDQRHKLDSFFYRECVYYLTNYGSHAANIAFYMKHSTLGEVIRYCYENGVDKETFTDSVYMECYKKDKVSEMLKAMGDMDSSFEMWSVKINDPRSIQFNLDRKTIDNLMTTFTRQIELTKYLANCEAANRVSNKVLHEIIPSPSPRSEDTDNRPLTLFGSNTDKMRLVAGVLVGGATVDAGFDLAFRIITEQRLDSMNIYSHVAKYLVNTDRFMEVKVLAKCIRGSKETAASLMSDQVLEAAVAAVVGRCEARGQLFDEQAELLIADVHSVAGKISCYIICHNVSSAYILAARHDRTNDLRRVLQEADRLGNDQVRNACLKRLTSKKS
ncbi:unnamed protein product [Leptidea sinapis]|uniref:FYVE-type domain-containing protein n=1 Tax=Leptidea sinapis TaxID=189913 RepID=A0A5E4R624_9NEOP|nr:unnamed protein product [Leptidea sinapis]